MKYDYECLKCKNVFTITKSMKDSDRDEYCPVCGSKGKKLYSFPAIVVKGRGSYTVSYSKFWNKNKRSNNGRK